MSRIFKYEPEPNERAIHRRVNEAIFCKIFKDGLTANEANRAVAAENGFEVVEDKQDATTNVPTSSGAKHISDLADIIVEASKNKIDRAGALEWLINNRHGRSFTQAYKREQGKESPMPDNLESLVKDFGVVAVAKSIVDRAHSTFTEEQFSKAIDDYAQRDRRPNETKEQAFSRVFCGNNDDALALRKAHQIVKNGATMTLVPTYVGAEQATDVNDATDALEQLMALAEKLRQAMPQLSKSQCFAKVYSDPNNAALALRERQQNRPAA